ncbi:MAG: nuclear transport factor 2 family protein, partial [Agitococcus sp.]|nr:nuclear transport factor 2 family protein [Agitococcus sp.]
MSDFQAIETVVNVYFKALYEGDADRLLDVFLSKAELFGYYEGELVTLKLAEYIN